MATIKPKALLNNPIKAECPTHARTHARMRSHEIVIDEPKIRGGTDLGPTPVETYFASLAGCTNVISHRIAEEMGIEMEDYLVEILGQLDNRGIRDEADIEVPFPSIELTIAFKTASSEGQVMALKEALTRRCPVGRAMRASGSDIIETWNVDYV